MAETKQRKRQEVKSDFATPWNPDGEGETIEGLYKGFDRVPSGRNQVDKDGNRKTFKSFRILPDGADVPIGVAGAMLERKMARIPRGTYVWITYVGDVKTNNGTAKDFKVECEEGTKFLEKDDDDDVPF